MRAEIIAIIAILIASVVLVTAQPPQEEPYIVIDDSDDKVKFNKLSVGDPWHVIMTDPSTGNVLYDFTGTIQDFNNQNPNQFIWFSYVSPGGLKNGIQKCIVVGSYNVHADVVHNGVTYEENGIINIEEQTCSPPIDPIPEIGTILMTSVGILGIFLITRKYRQG